ncbi:MAG: hypothetical protein GOMPHAMPRED_000900 [Gomphillus americanus]|uniref:Exoribonuclease phosphorolytic domain-containing protein n=1 Tax=Gomphillus americanus TaxID=1940652 RepID=A0A8H3F0E4_9LECA|nr:MAG: hypothetical protein GOMPHAMPRED_000900 [Gomphillus americanus]
MAHSVELDVLPDADGSCRFSMGAISVLASINGPLEVQRRDELPEEATIDVAVRPSAGLAGIRERFFEGLIHKTLKQVIKTKQFPRTLIQITLQITASPDIDAIAGRPHQAASLLYLLPSLLNAAMLALLCSSIALSNTFASTVIILMPNGEIISAPSIQQIQTAKSIHVLAYTLPGDLILVESEGSFDIHSWEGCLITGKDQCLGNLSDNSNPASAKALHTQFRELIEARTMHSESWRQNIDV